MNNEEVIELRPFRNESNDELLESARDYCERIKLKLPNLTDDIIEQWFYAHWGQIEDFFNDYPIEKFVCSLVEMPTEQIPFTNNGIDDYISEEVKKHSNEIFVERYKDSFFIKSYIQKHGTFPRPIILLQDNRSIESNYSKPFHLIEGHQRLSMMFILKNQMQLADKHKVWICELLD